MKHKKLFIILICEAAILIALTITTQLIPSSFTSIFAFPFEQIANALADLSRLGRVGSGLAMVILLLIASIPFIVAVFNRSPRHLVAPALTTIVIIVATYLMINPSVIGPQALDAFDVGDEFRSIIISSCGITIWSFVIMCVVLRMVRSFKSGDTATLMKYFRTVLYVVSMLFVAFFCLSPLQNLISEIKSFETNAASIPTADITFSILRFLVEAIPYVFDVVVCVRILDVICSVESHDSVCNESFFDTAPLTYNEAFHDEDAKLDNLQTTAALLTGTCCRALVVTVALTAGINLLQLVFMRYLTNIKASLNIPIVSIVFVLTILLISRLLVSNKKLKEDNELFI